MRITYSRPVAEFGTPVRTAMARVRHLKDVLGSSSDQPDATLTAFFKMCQSDPSELIAKTVKVCVCGGGGAAAARALCDCPLSYTTPTQESREAFLQQYTSTLKLESVRGMVGDRFVLALRLYYRSVLDRAVCPPPPPSPLDSFFILQTKSLHHLPRPAQQLDGGDLAPRGQPAAATAQAVRS